MCVNSWGSVKSGSAAKAFAQSGNVTCTAALIDVTAVPWQPQPLGRRAKEKL